MNSSIDTLIVTAHPDDETIFFSGPIFSRPRSRVHVVCATDGNADKMGEKRKQQFESAIKELGITGTMLGFPDQYNERLDVNSLIKQISEWSPKEVFTHNVHGEYGHPHHQDVSFACHTAFAQSCDVYSTAYNCFPQVEFELSEDQWQLKFSILSQIYWEETKRFQQFLPCSWRDGYLKMAVAEVKSVYQALQ
ncbi:MAG: PIG-L family deacetylase, partial [Pseudomonadota bacterium]